MLTSRAIIWAMVAPAVIALVAIAFAAIPQRKKRDAQPWGPALAIGAALLAAFWGIAGRPEFPPTLAEGWLVYLVVPAVILGAATMLTRARTWRVVEVLISAAVLALTAWLLSRPRAQVMEEREFWIQTSLVAAGFVVWWLALDQLSTRAPGPGIPILLALFVAGAALVLVNSHTQSLGQIAGGVAIAVGVISVIGLFLRGMSIARGGALALAVAALGLILCGHLYADMTRREMVTLWAAPLAMWLGEVPGVRKKTRLRFAVRAVAMMLVLAIVVVPAAKGLRETMREQTESYEY